MIFQGLLRHCSTLAKDNKANVDVVVIKTFQSGRQRSALRERLNLVEWFFLITLATFDLHNSTSSRRLYQPRAARQQSKSNTQLCICDIHWNMNCKWMFCFSNGKKPPLLVCTNQSDMESRTSLRRCKKRCWGRARLRRIGMDWEWRIVDWAKSRKMSMRVLAHAQFYASPLAMFCFRVWWLKILTCDECQKFYISDIVRTQHSEKDRYAPDWRKHGTVHERHKTS